MIIAKVKESGWIELLSEQFLDLHFGKVTIRMNKDELYLLASMFDLSTGEEMPDEAICCVEQLDDGNFIVTYRSLTMTMCNQALSRFAKLCLMGMKYFEHKKNANAQGAQETIKKWGHLSIV